jgi:hypothetical protein
MKNLEGIKEYLLENEEVLKDVVRELNSWNGCLDYLDVYENDEEFFTLFFKNPMEAVRATQFGNYNYSDDYVRFNGYGNLDSCSEWELLEDLKDNIDEIIDNLVENYQNLYLDSELTELLEEA